MDHNARGLELSSDSKEATRLFDLTAEHNLRCHADRIRLANDTPTQWKPGPVR